MVNKHFPVNIFIFTRTVRQVPLYRGGTCNGAREGQNWCLAHANSSLRIVVSPPVLVSSTCNLWAPAAPDIWNLHTKLCLPYFPNLAHLRNDQGSTNRFRHPNVPHHQPLKGFTELGDKRISETNTQEREQFGGWKEAESLGRLTLGKVLCFLVWGTYAPGNPPPHGSRLPSIPSSALTSPGRTGCVRITAHRVRAPTRCTSTEPQTAVYRLRARITPPARTAGASDLGAHPLPRLPGRAQEPKLHPPATRPNPWKRPSALATSPFRTPIPFSPHLDASPPLPLTQSCAHKSKKSE